MNIFSYPKNHALVAGGNLSPNTNINSVREKMKLNIISNRMRSIDMQSITMPFASLPLPLMKCWTEFN